MKNLIAILIVSIVLSGCGESKLKPQISLETGLEKIPDQETWDSEIIVTEDGILKAIVYSDHISVISDENQKLLDGVKIIFYDEEGIQTSSITSKRGRVDDLTQDMYAIDSVVAVSDSGVTLYTDELIWNSKKNKIVSDKFVRIVSDQEQIEGYGFESNQNMNPYTIYNITYYTNLNENNN
jgi:LPS export ABC transporter protein LptC